MEERDEIRSKAAIKRWTAQQENLHEGPDPSTIVLGALSVLDMTDSGCPSAGEAPRYDSTCASGVFTPPIDWKPADTFALPRPPIQTRAPQTPLHDPESPRNAVIERWSRHGTSLDEGPDPSAILADALGMLEQTDSGFPSAGEPYDSRSESGVFTPPADWKPGKALDVPHPPLSTPAVAATSACDFSPSKSGL